MGPINFGKINYSPVHENSMKIINFCFEPFPNGGEWVGYAKVQKDTEDGNIGSRNYQKWRKVLGKCVYDQYFD